MVGLQKITPGKPLPLIWAVLVSITSYFGAEWPITSVYLASIRVMLVGSATLRSGGFCKPSFVGSLCLCGPSGPCLNPGPRCRNSETLGCLAADLQSRHGAACHPFLARDCVCLHSSYQAKLDGCKLKRMRGVLLTWRMYPGSTRPYSVTFGLASAEVPNPKPSFVGMTPRPDLLCQNVAALGCLG